MEIARYSEKYHDDVQRLVKEFHAESLDLYGLTFNEQALDSTIEALKHEAYLVIIDGRAEGLMAGKPVTAPSSNEKIWHEVIWYVAKRFRKYGVRLFKQVREQLKERGFTALVMIYMHNSKSDKLARLYERLGFTAMETNYIGRL